MTQEAKLRHLMPSCAKLLLKIKKVNYLAKTIPNVYYSQSIIMSYFLRNSGLNTEKMVKKINSCLKQDIEQILLKLQAIIAEDKKQKTRKYSDETIHFFPDDFRSYCKNLNKNIKKSYPLYVCYVELQNALTFVEGNRYKYEYFANDWEDSEKYLREIKSQVVQADVNSISIRTLARYYKPIELNEKNYVQREQLLNYILKVVLPKLSIFRIHFLFF